jgi:hypothetical protein
MNENEALSKWHRDIGAFKNLIDIDSAFIDGYRTKQRDIEDRSLKDMLNILEYIYEQHSYAFENDIKQEIAILLNRYKLVKEK